MPLELSITFISLTLRSTWLYKSHMHISFRKENNTSKTIMQERVGYRNLRQWQVCEHIQNAALSTVSDRFEGPWAVNVTNSLGLLCCSQLSTPLCFFITISTLCWNVIIKLALEFCSALSLDVIRNSIPTAALHHVPNEQHSIETDALEQLHCSRLSGEIL